MSCKKNSDLTSINNDNSPTLSSTKKIISFSFDSLKNSTVIIQNAVGNIVGDSIIVNLEQGTPVNSLIPTIIFEGNTLSPSENLPQNFSNIVSYTVKANDGSTRNYAVKINFTKANNKVFIGSDDGNLYCLNARTGVLYWKYTTNGSIQSSPTVVDGIVYFGSNNKKIYALDANTGTLKWQFTTNTIVGGACPTISNGVLYMSCANYPGGEVMALDALTGTVKWSRYFAGPSSPTLYGDKLYFGSLGSGIYVLDKYTGNTISNLGMGITRHNPLAYNGKIYVAGETGFKCFDTTNFQTLWYYYGLGTVTSPTVYNNTIFAGVFETVAGYSQAEAYIESVNPSTGAVNWRQKAFQFNSNAFNSPTVENGKLFTTCLGIIYAMNTNDGSIAWKVLPTIPSNNNATNGFMNVTVANGTLICGNNDNFIYAFDANNGNLKWKFLTNGAVYSGPCLTDYDGNVFHNASSGSVN